MFWRGRHTFEDLHANTTDIGSYPPPWKTYFVSQAHGSDGNNGLGGWESAKETFQAGITAAISVDNKYKDVDLIVGPGEYDEEAVVGCSTTACQASSGDTWLGYKIGRLRIICMGKACVFKNSGVLTGHTLNVLRMKTEIYGGTWRNYTVDTAYSAIHFERLNSGDYGDVINAKLIGAKIEGRQATATNRGVDLDAAQYVWIEGCWFSGWDTAILVAGNGLGSCVETVIKECYFRGNTNDILMGASQFTVVDNCKFIDDTTSKYISDSDWSSRGGTPTDIICFNGVCAATTLGNFDATNLDVMNMGHNTVTTTLTHGGGANKGA